MEVIKKDIFAYGPYSVNVGTLKPDDSIHYMVIHRDNGVVEYETEVLAAAMAWAKHFSDELDKFNSGSTETIGQNILPFSLKPN